jgi:hypothetical protein
MTTDASAVPPSPEKPERPIPGLTPTAGASIPDHKGRAETAAEFAGKVYSILKDHSDVLGALTGLVYTLVQNHVCQVACPICATKRALDRTLAGQLTRGRG